MQTLALNCRLCTLKTYQKKTGYKIMKTIYYYSDLHPRKKASKKLPLEIVILSILCVVTLIGFIKLSDFTYYCSNASSYEQGKVDYKLFCYDGK